MPVGVAAVLASSNARAGVPSAKMRFPVRNMGNAKSGNRNTSPIRTHGRGDKEQVIKWLKIELADNNNCRAGLDREQDFVFLRTDPRFQALAKSAALR